jgi:hypothetical protein
MHNTTAIAQAGEKSESSAKRKLSFGESDKGSYSMFLKRKNREQGQQDP